MPFKTWFHGEKPPAYSTHDFDAKPPPPPTPEELEKARLKAKYAGVERAAVDS
ncbi:hypothetical protein MMC30_005129 [Trapelia coarctata]|nr:hypothetical protein [Trapelia coarctata]